MLSRFFVSFFLLATFACTTDAQTTIRESVRLQGNTVAENLSTFTFEGLQAIRSGVTVTYDLTVNGDFGFHTNPFSDPFGPPEIVLGLNGDNSRIDSFSVGSITDDDATADYQFLGFERVDLLDPLDDGNLVTGTITSEQFPFNTPVTEILRVPDGTLLIASLDQSSTLGLTLDSTNTTPEAELLIPSVDVAFGSVAVPEPTLASLILFAGCMLTMVRRRR